jgi:redox-sensitive bicupin YhaK (pirin superfamily)
MRLAQRMIAGPGIRHPEKDGRPAASQPLDPIQMWVRNRYAACLTAAGGRRLAAAEPGEVLTGEMHASVGRMP